jgi:integrase
MVPVSARLASLFAIAPAGPVPIVASLAGVPSISYGSARLHFVALCADAGISPGYTLHDLRRTIARELWDATRDLREVQSLLGHSSPKTTLHYLAGEVFSVTPSALARITGGTI